MKNNILEKRLYLDSLSACNESCLFCVKQGKTNQGNDYFFTNFEAKNVLADKIEEGYQEVVFTGGEPTLRPDLANLIEFSKIIGYQKASILTNAVNFSDKKKVLEIYELFSDDFNISFSVSLHSHIRKISEKITNTKNTFSKTVKGIKNLVKAGFDNISIYHVITVYNYSDLSEFVRFVSRLLRGVEHRTITFSFIMPQGAAMDNMDIFPRLSKVEHYLEKALYECREEGIQHSISTCGTVPLCFLKGNENIMIRQQELDRPENIRLVSRNQDEGFQLSTKNFHNKTKIKLEDCKKCLYFKKCAGIWKVYAEKFGTGELKPILSKKGKRQRKLLSKPSTQKKAVGQ